MSKYFKIKNHQSLHFFRGVTYSSLFVAGIATTVVLAGAATVGTASGVGLPLAILAYAAVGTAFLSVDAACHANDDFSKLFDHQHYYPKNT